jgi:flavorubredoxin
LTQEKKIPEIKVIVIYESLYGNTRKIAESLAAGIRKHGIATMCYSIREVWNQELASYDLIALGAPTHYQTSSEPTKEFLKTLESFNLRYKYGFAFDARKDSFFAGSAAKYIEKEMRKLGLNIIMPYSSGIIYTSSKGEESDKEARRASAHLREGEEEKFQKIGENLGELLVINKQQQH